MTLINQVAASDVSISTLTGTAKNIQNNWKLTDLFSKGGFNLINFVYVIIGLVFFANLIMAGWEYMLSSGDPKKVQAATTRILNGFIGIILAVAAFIIVRLVSQVFGLGGTTTAPII